MRNLVAILFTLRCPPCHPAFTSPPSKRVAFKNVKPYWQSLSPEDQREESSSVGDYVQGVHGGKYQFEEAGGVSFAGKQFAESLYSTDPSEGVVVEAIDDAQEVPTWAQTMGTSARLGAISPTESQFEVLELSPEDQIQIQIQITNDERSWEYYYCKIVQVSPDGTILDDTARFCHERPDAMPFQVSPAVGHLAPRGGSSNLCDPSKPYSDTSTIQVVLSNDASTLITNENNNHLLVVGTEAEKWFYWLSLSPG